MPFAQLSFSSLGGLNTGPRYLVERGPATDIAFIDPNWGSQGAETVLLNAGLQEAEVRDVSSVVPGGDLYPVSVEVESNAQGEFSIYDGSAWRGPYAVVGDVAHAMLVRLPTTTLRVKFKALQATGRVLVVARTVPSPRAMSAI